MSVLGSRLFERVLAESPSSTLCFHGWDARSFDDLREGVRDLVFSGGTTPPDLRSELLFEERFVGVVGRRPFDRGCGLS